MREPADQLVKGLESVLGAAAVQTDRATLLAHAVDGVVPAVVCAPGDTEQIASVLRLCGEAGAAVTPCGGGTTIGLGNLPHRVDVVLQTDRLASLGEHDDANLTATVQAGMPVGALQIALARASQFLAIDPPHPDRATVGGIVAANVNGPRRMFYGGVRDLVIGMKMVLAAGEQVKAGGKVVKNVAGYDMCKLFVGSLGTLGIITEVTFKMAPLPERSATIAAQGDARAAFRLVDDLFASTLQPSAIAVLNAAAARLTRPDGRGTPGNGKGALAAVAVEGFTEAVDRHIRDVTAMAQRAGLAVDLLEGEAHAALWASVRDFPSAGNGDALVRVTVPLGAVAAAVDAISRAAGSEAAVVAHAGTGTIWTRTGAPGAREVFAGLIASAGSHGGHAVLAAAPAEVKRDLDVWGPAPAALSIMREIKQRFDPQQLLNPGRFVAFL